MKNGFIVQQDQGRSGSVVSPGRRQSTEANKSSEPEFLKILGERVRSARTRQQWTRKNLAKKSGVSERYLAQLEAGKGNASVLLLRQVAEALGLTIEYLVGDGSVGSEEFRRGVEILRRLTPEQLRRAHSDLLKEFESGAHEESRRARIALIGLRGAGKSTLGTQLAEKLDVPFLELDRLVEQESGLTLSAIFDLYGPPGFHRYERQCLDGVLARYSRFVLAVGGSLVTEEATFDVLLHACYTVWLRASPEDHMNRVVAQGDRRPMAASPQAMADLRRILSSREALYMRADASVETSGKNARQSLQEVLRAVGETKEEPQAQAL